MPLSAIQQLRTCGWDVEWVGDTMAEAADAEVLERARDTDRLLLTQDKDFGHLALSQPKKQPGVVLLRMRGAKAAEIASRLQQSLLAEMDILFPKTDDVVALMKLLPPHVTVLAEMREAREILSAHAVETRYPGAEVVQTEVTEAMKAAKAVRQEVRAHLNLRP